MPTVLEEELGRPVLCVLGRLLGADEGEVPDVDAAVGAGGGEDGLVVRAPGEADDVVRVRLERVQRRFQGAQVPQPHRLVRRARREQVLVPRREQHAVHLGRVRLDAVLRLRAARLARPALARVPHQHLPVVRDGDEERGRKVVERNVLQKCPAGFRWQRKSESDISTIAISLSAILTSHLDEGRVALVPADGVHRVVPLLVLGDVPLCVGRRGEGREKGACVSARARTECKTRS